MPPSAIASIPALTAEADAVKEKLISSLADMRQNWQPLLNTLNNICPLNNFPVLSWEGGTALDDQTLPDISSNSAIDLPHLRLSSDKNEVTGVPPVLSLAKHRGPGTSALSLPAAHPEFQL